MIAFTPAGPILPFTAATTAPTAVQAISLDGVGDQQYVLTNTDSAVDVFVGWGDSSDKAKAAATGAAAASAVVSNCYYLMHSTQVVVTGPRAAYFSGKTASSTAVVQVQAGYGN